MPHLSIDLCRQVRDAGYQYPPLPLGNVAAELNFAQYQAIRGFPTVEGLLEQMPGDWTLGTDVLANVDASGFVESTEKVWRLDCQGDFGKPWVMRDVSLIELLANAFIVLKNPDAHVKPAS